MSLPSLAVRRPVTFLMLFVGLVAIGIISLTTLKINLFPELELPTVAVITTYAGTAPEDMETLITEPIEEAIATVQDLDTLSSESQEGLSVVIAEFSWGADLVLAEQDVRKNIDLVTRVLPEDADEPMIFRFDPNLLPIMGISVSGDLPPEELRVLAEDDVEPRLERIKGVAAADTRGGEVREIQVQVNREKLTARGVTLPEVVNAIARENRVIPVGTVEDSRTEYTIRTLGEYDNLDQISHTVVTLYDRVPIYVQDVATVVDGQRERRSITRVNQEPAVVVEVRRASGANTVEVTQSILKQLPALEKAVPGISLSVIYQEAETIQESIANLFQTIILAVILCGLVLLVFLGSFRTTLIVLLSIPISVIATFMVMNLFDVTLNVVSMGGLALGVGLFVDNSIVVLESIFRHRERGEPAVAASVVGAGEVSTAIAASTLTTVCVFFPLVFVPGIPGQMFLDMSLTVVFSLLVSLFVALSLIPLVSSRFLTKFNTDSTRGLARILGTRKLIERASLIHGRMLQWSLGHRIRLLALVAGIFVLSMVIVTRFVGTAFFPDVDTGSVNIAIKRDVGTALAETDETFRVAEEIIRDQIPELKAMTTTIGAGGGMMGMGSQGSYAGNIRLELVKKGKRDRSTAQVENVLRTALVQALPQAEIRFVGDVGFGGPTSPGSATVQIYGYDLSTLLQLSQQIEAKLAEIPGVADIESSAGRQGRPQLNLQYDRDKIYDLGMSTSTISQLLQTAVQGSTASRYKEGGREYDIVVRMEKLYRSTLKDIGALKILTPSGGSLRVKEVVNENLDRTPVSVTRKDQQRIVTVDFRVVDRPLGNVLADIQPVLAETNWPAEFSWKVGGSAEDLQESFQWLGYALLVGLALVYMVMASQFESLRDPFIIFLTIPLSMIGVAWMLFFTGTTANIFSIIGIIVMVGIVINNSIVLIDYINLLRQRSQNLHDATEEAARVRFRPVLMTALTTILAMLPLAIGIGAGAETWAPMARSVIGGLVAGTFSTLLVIPVLYVIFEERRERRLAKAKIKE